MLLVLAAAGVALVTWFVWAFLAMYGDTNAAGSWQALGLAAMPFAVVVLLAVAGGWFRHDRSGLVAAVLVVVAGLMGAAVAGELAVRAKYTALPRTPSCLMVEPEDGKGSVDPRAAEDTRRAQAVFDALNHPGPFTGAVETGMGSCAAMLASDDLDGVLAFYRTELVQKGWTITADRPPRLSATKDGLTIEVALLAEAERDAPLQVRVTLPEEA